MKKNFNHYKLQFILVNDGSSDNTKLKLDELKETHQRIIDIVHFPFNKGRGKAIKAGIKASIGDYIIVLDADLSYDVNHILEIMTAFENSPSTDTVVVSPYMRGGVVKNVPLNRLILSRLANWILAGFFDGKLSTVTCVVRGYRGNLIRELPLFEDGKELHLEILRKLSLTGANIVEIPGRLIWKKEGKLQRRKTNLKFVGAAKNHVLYGLMVKPTQLFKFLSIFLLFLGLYEGVNILSSTIEFYTPNDDFIRNLWQALKSSYNNSPHTYIITAVSLILSFQTMSYWSLSQVAKMQHEEMLKHVLEILKSEHNKKLDK